MTEMLTLERRDYDMAEIARPLAEDLAPDFVRAAVRLYETRRSPAGLFRSAWNQIEYAMNEGVPDNEVDAHFDTTTLLVGELVSRENVHQDVRLGTLMLATYLPLFRKRTDKQRIEPEDCKDVYESIGAALHYLRPLQTDEPPQWRMAEAAVLALSARSGRPELLLYPASPREEQSSNRRMNHDSYFYVDNDKLPLQQKLLPTEKVYDECVTVLTLMPIVDKGLKMVPGLQSEGSLSDRVNYLLSLIITETAGSSLTKDETKFLNFMTSAVAAHNISLRGGRRSTE